MHAYRSHTCADLTKANVGQGIVAGLAVAFIAIIPDRLLEAAARRMRNRAGSA